MTRFVIDETSLADVAPGELAAPATGLIAVFERLLERLATIRERNETVSKHASIHEVKVAGQALFVDVLYGPDYEYLGRDLRLRLMLAVEQTANWDVDFTPANVQVTIAGRTFSAPSIAAVWECAGGGTAVACVPLQSADRRGSTLVAVGGIERAVHFVTTDSEHVAFFRAAIELEDTPEDRFRVLATSAFPSLDWADGVWNGLSNFSRPFRDVRQDVTAHLGVLNDHGVDVFEAFSAHGPDQVGARLSAFGATASDENGRTKRNRDCERDRTRTYRGHEVTFWRHTKLQP